MTSVRPDRDGGARQYLFANQLATLTPWSADRIRHMVADGTFKQGVHYFRPGGRRPVFSWAAVVEYITAGASRSQEPEGLDGDTRQARALLR